MKRSILTLTVFTVFGTAALKANDDDLAPTPSAIASTVVSETGVAVADLAEPTKSKIAADFYAKWVAGPVRLDSERGRALRTSAAPDYAPLLEKWVPQLRSHCGACSAVIVQNSLLPGASFTQDSIFNAATAAIISQETVYKVGFTLAELTKMIRTSSALRAERYHAGLDAAAGEHGYEVWLSALRADRLGARDRLICNFATGWLRERKNTGGHFSIVADYNEAEDKVLILEVSGGRPSFWVDTREMWDAMNQVDKISGRVRGWIVVSRDE
jgi:Phytochelatin synthase